MAKIENPYAHVLDEIRECLSLHKLEANRIARDVIESQLEEKVKKYVNDPKVAEIKAKKKISEDDQGYLDINIFWSTFSKNKLDLSKNFEKEYKKFLVLTDEYKNLIQERITQFELNASLLSKFTDEEIKNNPKLSKMMKAAPEGFNDVRIKFIKADAELSKIYADYISRNSEDYATKLFNFLNESKKFRKQFTKMKQNEIEGLKEKTIKTENNGVLPRNSSEIVLDFAPIKELLKNKENMSNEDFNELKSHLSKVLTPVQLAELNAFEESFRNEYNNSISKDSLIKKRLDNSLNQFQRGVDRITNLIVETGSLNALHQSILGIENELFSKSLEDVKKDSAYINVLIGCCCGIKRFLSENTVKKSIFRKADTGIEGIEKVHKELSTYLINKVGVEESLLGNDMLATMITKDKLGELAYVLMNNATRISNVSDISNWEVEVNKIIANCISEMIILLEQGKAPTQAIIRFKEQYLSKSSNETKKLKEGETRKRQRTRVSQDDQASKIKRILQ